MRKNLFLPIYILLLLLFLIRLVPFIFHESRLWGLNHLIFLPDIYTCLYIPAAVLALAIPLILKSSDPGQKAGDWFGTAFYESSRKYLFRLGVVIPAGVLFALFAAPTHFLGDGYTLLGNLASEQGTFYKWSEKGITIILTGIQTALGGRNEQTAVTAFRIISVFSGVVSIWFFFKIAGVLFEDGYKRMILFLVSLFSASLLLFFGYVENYPLLWAVFIVFTYFCLRYLKTGRGFIYCLLFLIIGLFLHLQFAFLIPAFIYLLLSRGAGNKIYSQYRPFIRGSAGAVLGAIIVFFVYKYQNDIYFENIFLPLFSGKPSAPEYALLSIPHLADILNQFILISPLILVIFMGAAKNIKNIFNNKVSVFLLLVSLGGMLFLFVIDPKLGMPRDWDLFSISAFAPALLFVYLLHDDFVQSFKRITISLIIYLVVAVMPFLIVNLNTDHSIKQIEYLADLDRGKSMSTLVTLRDYYGGLGQTAKGDSVNNIIPVRFPNVKKMQDVFIAIRQKEFSRAMSIAQSITPDKFSTNYHSFMVKLYLGMRNYPKALEESDMLIQLQKYNFKYYLNRAYIYMGMEQPDNAITTLSDAYKYNPNSNQVVEMLSAVHYNLSHFDSSEVYADILLAQDSANVAGYYFLCKANKMQGNDEKARMNFSLYMQKGTVDPLFNNRKNELNEIMNR